MIRSALSLAIIVFGGLAVPAVLAQNLSPDDQAVNTTATLGQAAPAPTAWLGATPHFVMVGEFGGYGFNINLPDLAAAPDAAVTGKREYGHNDAGGLALIDFEVAVNAVMNDIERTIELEFANADFNTATLPLSYVIESGEEFPVGAKASLEVQFEWEWVEKSTIVNEEGLIDSGSLDLALNEGNVAADGTAPTGLIGGFATASKDGKTLAISFTVPVTEAEIDD
tara:strand:+ start:3062 stop:3736 length:675 start_codon:yes stop_codon:yes gene_type:complete